MRALEIEDFSRLVELEESIEESDTSSDEERIEQIKNFYEEQIETIQKECQQQIESIRKQSFQEGYTKAKEELERVYQEEKERIEKEYKQQIRRKEEELYTLFQRMDEGVKREFEELKEKFLQTVTGALTEILEFLFIDRSNEENIKKTLYSIIEDFDHYIPLRLVLSPSLAEKIGGQFHSIAIKKDETLKDHEFVIEFHDFKIENHLDEKLEVLKDEIKRAIEKPS